MSSPSSTSAPLDRFPPEVRSAFARFRSAGDASALRVVVTAVVASFMPAPKDGSLAPAVTPETALIDDLGFDSVAIAETVFFFEDLFGVSISNRELAGLRTVADMCRYIEYRGGAVRASS